jgi:hypothetical protein
MVRLNEDEIGKIAEKIYAKIAAKHGLYQPALPLVEPAVEPKQIIPAETIDVIKLAEAGEISESSIRKALRGQTIGPASAKAINRGCEIMGYKWRVPGAQIKGKHIQMASGYAHKRGIPDTALAAIMSELGMNVKAVAADLGVSVATVSDARTKGFGSRALMGLVFDRLLQERPDAVSAAVARLRGTSEDEDEDEDEDGMIAKALDAQILPAPERASTKSLPVFTVPQPKVPEVSR